MSAVFEPYFVLIVLLIIFILIYVEVLKPAISFLLAVLIFTITGILDTHQVLNGFSNTSIAIIILLIVISAGLRKNFKLELLFDALFKKSKTYRNFLIRMMSQAAITSTIINNTPVVALMTPYVFNYGLKNNIAPSKLLIPLSYATIIGGMITLIGTSTTLILNGFIEERGHIGLQFDDLLLIGLSVTVTGILFITFFGYRLLPDRRDTMQEFARHQREYILETGLGPDSPLINRSVKEAGLRNLKGVYLVEIIRGDRIISPVDPGEIIEKDDVLFFAGDTGNIMDLINTSKGIMLPEKASSYHQDKIDVIEVVVAGNSSLSGKTVKEANFRNRYDAAIIAIHRDGEKLSGKIGDIELKPSDVLLLYAGRDFNNRVDLYRDLFVINKVREIAEPGRKKYYALILIFICAVILFITKGLALFPSLLIIFTIMAGFKLITIQDIRREIDFNLIAILVLSLAIGQAMIVSGAGDLVAGWLMDVLASAGKITVLIGIIVITNILTSFIVNVGAVSIMFPIALSLSQQLGIDGMPLYLGIAYAASGAFITPIGYQTNMIIYGPGGYRFKDFMKIGLPVTVLYLIIAFLAILFIYKQEFI